MGRPVIPDPIVQQVDAPATKNEATKNEASKNERKRTRRRAPVLHMGLPLSNNYPVLLAYRKIFSAKIYHGIGWLQTDLARIRTYKHQAKNMTTAVSQCLSSPGNADQQPAPGLSFEEWEAWLGRWDIIADLASFFAPHLIDTYKHSKVVLVERNVDEWIRDMDETLVQPLFSLRGYFFARFIEPLAGSQNNWAMRKLLIAYFQAQTREEMLANMRGAYENHYNTIRSKVPRERLLEFKVEQGWAPLCLFLGEPVPDGPFPKEDELSALKGFLEDTHRRKVKVVALRIGLVIFLCTAVALGVWAYITYT